MNIHCLEGVDLASFEVVDFDGAHWEQSIDELRQRSALVARADRSHACGSVGFAFHFPRFFGRTGLPRSTLSVDTGSRILNSRVGLCATYWPLCCALSVRR